MARDGRVLSVGEAYDLLHAGQARSPTLRRVWAHAAGGDFPEEFGHISFLTRGELGRLSRELRVGTGSMLGDLGCGTGGPGLWIVRETGAALVGIDISPVAVARAAERAAALGLAERARYQCGSFAATGLADASLDAALSVDALPYAPDKLAVLLETGRILRPGTRFVFTTFEVDPLQASQLPGLSDPVGDYRPLLETAGLSIALYEETPGWRERLRATYEAMLWSRSALIEEMGETAVKILLWEISEAVERALCQRRVLAVVERP